MPKVEHKSKIVSEKIVEDKDCTPPQWAIELGHKDMWLEHHGCK